MHCKVVVTMSFFTTGSGIVRQVAAPQILPGQNGDYMFSIFLYQNNKSRKKNPIRHGEVVPSLEI
jgi:hypothetical protein